MKSVLLVVAFAIINFTAAMYVAHAFFGKGKK